MEPLFVAAKILVTPGKTMIAYDHYKVLSVIMTITVLLRFATHEQVCDVRICCVCKLYI